MGQNLIDKLVTVCGSPSRAAGELGVSRWMMSQLMDGSKQLSPEAAALAAHIVGSDPYREAAEAMVKNCKDARKAERLTQAFHLPRSIGGAAMLLIFVIGGLFGTADASAKCINPGLTVYTLWQLLRRARTRAKDWTRAGFRLSGNAFRASRHYLRPQTLERMGAGVLS